MLDKNLFFNDIMRNERFVINTNLYNKINDFHLNYILFKFQYFIEVDILLNCDFISYIKLDPSDLILLYLKK